MSYSDWKGYVMVNTLVMQVERQDRELRWIGTRYGGDHRHYGHCISSCFEYDGDIIIIVISEINRT